jgi:hypothetical protein
MGRRNPFIWKYLHEKGKEPGFYEEKELLVAGSEKLTE